MSASIGCNIKHKQLYKVERRPKVDNKLLGENTTHEKIQHDSKIFFYLPFPEPDTFKILINIEIKVSKIFSQGNVVSKVTKFMISVIFSESV